MFNNDDNDKETYKSLGNIGSKHHQTWGDERKKFKTLPQETRKLLETKLQSRNLIKEINTWAVPLIRYLGPFLKLARKELQQIDQKIKQFQISKEYSTWFKCNLHTTFERICSLRQGESFKKYIYEITFTSQITYKYLDLKMWTTRLLREMILFILVKVCIWTAYFLDELITEQLLSFWI